MTDRVCGSDFLGSAPLRASGRKRGCHSEARPRCNRTLATQVAGPRNLPSAHARPDAAAPRNTCGGETAGQGRPGASRRATRKRKVDSSVAHRLWDWPGAGCALPRNDRLGGREVTSGPPVLRAPCWTQTRLSFRGPAALQSDARPAGCRAEESTVGPCEAGRGSPRNTCGGETAGQGRPGVSWRATRKRKVDSSVAHRLWDRGKVPGVRSLGMTDRVCGQGLPVQAARCAAC
jgi:hypothetical protein